MPIWPTKHKWRPDIQEGSQEGPREEGQEISSTSNDPNGKEQICGDLIDEC